MSKQRWLFKFLGWFLLVWTVGVASCQALFTRSSELPNFFMWSAGERS
ncbi:MAG: hypothetical protein WAN46_08535 [Gammaproteobacteria bacterium]